MCLFGHTQLFITQHCSLIIRLPGCSLTISVGITNPPLLFFQVLEMKVSPLWLLTGP